MVILRGGYVGWNVVFYCEVELRVEVCVDFCHTIQQYHHVLYVHTHYSTYGEIRISHTNDNIH